MGFRPEWMRITSRLYGLDSVVTTDYWMAYPTLHVSYAIDERQELRLNYSLRVNRPEADALTSDAFMAFFQALLDAAA